MPEGRLCPQCGQLSRLKGPTPSKRLGEPFWTLHCQKGHCTYWWKRKGKLEPLPAETLEKLHSRSNRFKFPIPRCDHQGCDRFGKKMAVNVYSHPLKKGGTCKIAHFRCDGQAGHVLYLSMPNGHPVTKEEWGCYRWTHNGEAFETIPGRAADGTTRNWRPADWYVKPVEWRIIGDHLRSADYTSQADLFSWLDSTEIIKCPYAVNWRDALDKEACSEEKMRNCSEFIRKIRAWVKKPGRIMEKKSAA
jgi:hypothetical protein